MNPSEAFRILAEKLRQKARNTHGGNLRDASIMRGVLECVAGIVDEAAEEASQHEYERRMGDDL